MASQMVKLLWEVELCQYESTNFYGSKKNKDEKHNIFSYFTYEEVTLPTSTLFLPQLLAKVSRQFGISFIRNNVFMEFLKL